MEGGRQGLLAGYRVLDLSDEKGFFCGKVLADLGADVIKVEPPGGCAARNIGPFYNDIPHPEKSLFWFAYNANKRGITLNLECEDGREIYKKLLTTVHVVIESFPPGYMKDLSLGYDDLCRIKSDIILISITPFGQNGPYKNFQTSDLACWSMGGFTYITGDPDRPPVQLGFPQAYLTGANEAAVAAMLALYFHEISGEGQHVDVSIQASITKNMMNAPLFYEATGVNLGRAGPFRVGLSLSTGQRVIWKCKDGEVSFFFWGGKGGARTNRALVESMDKESLAPIFMKEIEWESFDMTTASEELFSNVSDYVGRFFLTHTKKELFREAIKRKMTLYPVQNAEDITADPQLKERDFWEGIKHPELGRQLLYPNSPFILSEKLNTKKRRAPLIGEHNEEIYLSELGMSREEMIRLQEMGAI
jgi:crotonobetainyl-CoA:carnitine CoA-transferase CaiB-like acyl-CoA transferase